MNWERRKQSEQWVREKVNEFNKTTSGLTFAEWCYQQGNKDGIEYRALGADGCGNAWVTNLKDGKRIKLSLDVDVE